jgi:hypothetical protein
MTNWVRKHMMDWQYPTDIRETELAYLAGILDGEGVISIHAHTKRRQSRGREGEPYKILQPVVQVYNTNLDLILWLQNRIGFKFNGRDRRKARTSYQVVVTGYRTYSILTPLLPYLIAKKPLAELVIEYVLIRAERSDLEHNPLYGQREVKIWQTLQELNWKRFDPFVVQEYANLSLT